MDSYTDNLLSLALASYEAGGSAADKPMFDLDVLDAKEKEYEKWVQSLSHSKLVPLGMRREDYVLQTMGNTDMDIESGEGDDELPESDDEEEDEEEGGLANDYIEEDSDIFDSFSLPEPPGVLLFDDD